MQKLIIALLICSACSSPKLYRFEKQMMGMHLCVQVNRKHGVETIIKNTFAQIDQIFNNWNPESEISQLNKLPAGERVEISDALAIFLNKVGQIVEITEGKFDPTIAPVVHMWKTYLKNGTIPSQEELKCFRDCVGWHNIHLEGNTFYKDHDLTALDFGGVAKGYAIDLLVEKLGTPCYVEWGGEIRCLGRHVSGRKWKIGVRGAAVIELENAAIATSGSYLQNWSVGGITYTHIVDPTTLMPLTLGKESIVSATFVCEECYFADGIATALTLFPTKEAAEKWLQEKFPIAPSAVIDASSWHDPSLVFSLAQ
ncbi:MAG: FAD:protein FMN transferase [Chlamydiales bacterium]